MTRSRIFGYLSSWWTTAGILLCLVASYVACLFGDSPYSDWTTFIFRKPLGILLYCSLSANILSAAFRIIIAGIRKPQLTVKAVQAMDIYSSLPAEKLKDLAGLMNREGFSVTETESSVHAVKHRYSFLPGTIARAGIVLLLVSVLASAQARKSSETILHEGESMQAFGRQVLLKTVSSDIPGEFLQLGEDGSFRLNAVKAELQSSALSRTITTGFPVRIDGLYYRITHFGFMQPAAIHGMGLDRTINLDLDILPPGRTDLISLTQELFLAIALQPERTISKGLIKGKEFNLQTPFFHLVFQKGMKKEKIDELNIREGESAASSNVSIFLGRHSHYLKIQAVSDPALPFIYAGSLLTLLGIFSMFSRFFWYNKKLAAVFEGNTLHVGYQEEFFGKWASQKFHNWIEEYTQRGGI